MILFNPNCCINLNSDRGDDWNDGLEALEEFDHYNGLLEFLDAMKDDSHDVMLDSIAKFKEQLNEKFFNQFGGKLVYLDDSDSCDYIEFTTIEEMIYFKFSYMFSDSTG